MKLPFPFFKRHKAVHVGNLGTAVIKENGFHYPKPIRRGFSGNAADRRRARRQAAGVREKYLTNAQERVTV